MTHNISDLRCNETMLFNIIQIQILFWIVIHCLKRILKSSCGCLRVLRRHQKAICGSRRQESTIAKWHQSTVSQGTERKKEDGKYVLTMSNFAFEKHNVFHLQGIWTRNYFMPLMTRRYAFKCFHPPQIIDSPCMIIPIVW